jgi:hypothetical protein
VGDSPDDDAMEGGVKRPSLLRGMDVVSKKT